MALLVRIDFYEGDPRGKRAFGAREGYFEGCEGDLCEVAGGVGRAGAGCKGCCGCWASKAGYCGCYGGSQECDLSGFGFPKKHVNNGLQSLNIVDILISANDSLHNVVNKKTACSKSPNPETSSPTERDLQ